MRISIIGQAAFGESVFNALRDAGEEIVAVSAVEGAPERPDPLWAAAQAAGVSVFPTGSLKKRKVLDAYAATAPDLCVMAFVTHILPSRVLSTPRLGSIQYHPSLLPRHRGRSAMHWAIRHGDEVTGVTIFWVDEGIDTGPVLLQRQVEIGADDTVGSLYFDRLYALGVDCMAESVRMVREGSVPRAAQDESQATYEPPADDANSSIDWSQPAAGVYNLVRGSNPQPGAHARLRGELVRIFDARLVSNDERARPGTVIGVGDEVIEIALADGILRVQRLQQSGGKKVTAGEFARDFGLKSGEVFEDGVAD